jgi:cytochrome c biogenesis protein CcmG/thiol:disulfide interchange protein DsbE
MRRLLFVLPVLLFVALAGYFALALRPGRDSHELPSAMIDKEMPAFDLAALKGDAPLTPATIAGQPALVNFFASWCLPCRVEHPLLMRLKEREGISVYGIAYKDNPDDAARFLAQFGDPYRSIGLDRNGRAGLDFGVYGVPETYVLDRTGHIRKRIVGPLTAAVLEKDVLPLLRLLARP